MKSLWIIGLIIVIGGGSCLKKEGGCSYKVNVSTAPPSEEQELVNYLTANGISATKHGSNMYYEVLDAGNGSVPGLCSDVKVTYTGRLTNGSLFDSRTNTIFQLGILIDGWKLGLPLIQKGGHIKLYIPPSLGYGDVGVSNGTTVIIPANSILIFDITLSEVM